MRTLRSAMALLPAFLLAAALCGCAASPPGESPGSAPAKPVDAADFMSCAGPVFPLTLEKAAPELSADREVLLDCAPYAEENTAAITVTDRYTLQNSSDEDCTVTVLYPFVSSLSDLDSLQPSLTVDGSAVKNTLYPGAFPGWFGPASPDPELAEERWNLHHAESWTEYQTLLTGSYQADALAPKTLPEQTVYVYSFTASGETTANAATLAITVDADPEKTTILTYGINGYGQNEATGQPQYSYFTRVHNQTLHLLAVLGQDLTGCAMQGYTDGSCEQGKELDTLEGTVTRTELPLAELLRQIAAAQLGADASADEVKRLAAAAAELLTQYGVCSATPAERYREGRLDDLLQDAASACRARAGSDRLRHAGLYGRQLRTGEGTGYARRNRDAHGTAPCGASAADCRRAARRGRLCRRGKTACSSRRGAFDAVRRLLRHTRRTLP